jgi:hypothetical protein
MSRTIPTRHDVTRLSRALELEHARAERFRAMYERKVRPRSRHNDVDAQAEATALLKALPRDPDYLTEARREALDGATSTQAALEYLLAPRDPEHITQARQQLLGATR